MTRVVILLLVLPLLTVLGKNNPKSEDMPIQRTNAGKFTNSQQDTMKNQRHPLRQESMVLEERMVTYTEQKKSKMKKNVEMLEDIEQEDAPMEPPETAKTLTNSREDAVQKQNHPKMQNTMVLDERIVNYNDQKKVRMKRTVEMFEDVETEDILVQPPKNSQTPKGSKDELTPPKRSGDSPTSTVKPKPVASTTNPPLLGKNNSKSGELIVPKTKVGNVTMTRKEAGQKQKHTEGLIGNTGVQSPEIAKLQEGSPSKGSGNMPTSTVKPKPTATTTKPPPKNKPQSVEQSIQRTNAGNVAISLEEAMQNQNHPVRPTIMVLDERNVNYKDKKNTKKKGNIEMFEDIDQDEPLMETPETGQTPKGSINELTPSKEAGNKAKHITAPAKPSLLEKNKSRSEMLSILPKSPTAVVLDEKIVNYNFQKNTGIERNIEMFEDLEQEDTPVQPPDSTKTPKGSTGKPQPGAATHKPPLSGKNIPHFGEMPIQRTNARIHLAPRKDAVQILIHLERQEAPFVLDEKNIAFIDHKKTITKRNIEFFEDIDQDDSPVESPETSQTPKASSDRVTPSKGSGDIPTCTVKSKSSNTTTKSFLLGKSYLRSEQLSIQRTDTGDTTAWQNEVAQNQNHPERQIIKIIDEKNVDYNDQKKSRMKRSIEMLEYFEQENTPVQSAGTFKTPEGSDHGFLPPKESGNIPSSTVKPKTKVATNKPSLLGKNKPQSRESTTGRIGAGNVTVSQKGEMHKQKNPEKPSIRIVEKRKVTHNGEDQEKSGIDRNTEMYAGVSTAMLFFAEASGSGSGEGPEDSWTSTVEPAPQTIFSSPLPDSTMKQTSPESTGGTEGESLRTEPTVSSLTEIPTDTNAVSYTATDKTSVSTAETSTIVVTTAEASSLLAISTETSPVYDPTTGEISTAVEIITETSFTAAETSPVVDTTVETSSLPKVSIETSPVVDTTEETSSLPKVSIETSPVVDTTVETSSLPKISIETSPVVDTTAETSSLPKVSIETSPVVKTYETTGAVSSTTATVPVIDTTLGKVSATPPTIRPVSSSLPHTTEQEIVPTTFIRTTTPTATPTATTTTTTTTTRTTTATTETPTTIATSARTTATTASGLCLNGATYDGIKCICRPMFYGPRCETILDRIDPVKSVNTSVKVELKITNKPFYKNYENNQSVEYKEFETEFKVEMGEVYKDLEGYRDVEILKITNGSIIVDHKVIVEIQYKENANVTEQYEHIFEQVKEKVETVKNTDCTDTNTTCYEYDKTYGNVTEEEIKDYCTEIIPPGFKEFYTEVITSEGLTCISHCDPSSSRNYYDCNEGQCVIQKETGAHCYCARTDLYIYTGPKCTGRILKSGAYGGVGAAIAILLIIIATVAFFIYNEKKKKTSWDMYSKDDRDKWYDDDDEWSQERGFNNVSLEGEPKEEDSSGNSQSSKEKFRPRLEKVDPTLQFKIQRPEVSTA